MPKIIDCIKKAIRSASAYNPDVQAAPACILWPDRDHQWEAVIPLLREELRELLILGDYAPDKRTGPAIWLRCVLADRIEEIALPADHVPIFYLPGVSRQDLRATESCPDHIKPLAELQYRGVIWSQANAKDWTIPAYLRSDHGGLGLDVASDSETKNAMQLALHQLLDEELELISGKHLDKDYFNTLLAGDPTRDLLLWLDHGEEFQANCGKNEWKAFVGICKSQLAFNPQTEGPLAGASKLASHVGSWNVAWQRFCEAPKRYPNIPSQIRKCRPPSDALFWNTDDESLYGWPQWNEDQEKNLRLELLAFGQTTASEARNKIVDLEKQHRTRRSLVWAELGYSPLAMALEHMATMVEYSKSSLAAGSVSDLAAGYVNWGWKVDDGMVRALVCADNKSDLEAITAAIRVLYQPWAEESARHLQKIVDGSSYPGGNCRTAKPMEAGPGDCLMFVDGLRFDLGKRLAESLGSAGLNIVSEPSWAALPSVTATGKAAVSPVLDKITGQDGSVDFDPSVAGTGQSLKNGYQFKKLLADAEWTVLDKFTAGDGKGLAWSECGDIDHRGHEFGQKLVKHLDTQVLEIRDRVIELLSVGWKRVRIVTDHGWLLMPGGLPKSDLPSVLSLSKWGRCAVIKSGASTGERLYPWFWNPNEYFALADGISCFKNGEEYAHGGLSLQECLTLKITASCGLSEQGTDNVKFTDVIWNGLRCTVSIEGNFSGLSIDVRLKAGEKASSVLGRIKSIRDDGTASVVVEDEDMEGHDAAIVLIDESGSLAGQFDTVIGGGNL